LLVLVEGGQTLGSVELARQVIERLEQFLSATQRDRPLRRERQVRAALFRQVQWHRVVGVVAGGRDGVRGGHERRVRLAEVGRPRWGESAGTGRESRRAPPA